jgi:hypothetical protein
MDVRSRADTTPVVVMGVHPTIRLSLAAAAALLLAACGEDAVTEPPPVNPPGENTALLAGAA